MRRPSATLGLLLCLFAHGVLSWSCAAFREAYEYEEQITLGLDGSATVTVNASIPSLVAFHGLPLDLDPETVPDREAVGRLFEAPGVRVTHVSRPWERYGRQFIQVQVEVDRVELLPRATPFSWAEYSFEGDGEQRVFRHTITAPGDAIPVGWTGRELVAVRINVPSRIEFHNAPSGEVERGNLLVWEQTLPRRLRGEPLAIEVVMQADSIFVQTLTVFVVASLVGLGSLTLIAWGVRRRGRRNARERRASVSAPASRP